MSTFDFEEYVKQRDSAQQTAVQWARDLQAQHEDALGQVQELQTEVERLEAKVAELEEGGGPEPTGLRTVYGGCPAKGGESLAAQTTVVTKYGKGAAVRQFFGSTTVAPRNPDVSLVHGSWKPSLTQITETWVTTITKNLKDGDVVEVWHESDKKVTDGAYTYDDLLARKNKFYDTVKKVRPGLLVCNTVTGWLMDPKSGKDPSRWGAVQADILGIDCDGIRPTKLPYTNYEDETKAAQAFITKYAASGYRCFSVPEFGCPRIPDADPSGVERAKYHEHYAKLWMSTGACLYVTLYEYNSSPNYSLEMPAEKDQWSKAVEAGFTGSPL